MWSVLAHLVGRRRMLRCADQVGLRSDLRSRAAFTAPCSELRRFPGVQVVTATPRVLVSIGANSLSRVGCDGADACWCKRTDGGRCNRSNSCRCDPRRGHAAWRTRVSMPSTPRSRKLAERFLLRVFRPCVPVAMIQLWRFEPGADAASCQLIDARGPSGYERRQFPGMRVAAAARYALVSVGAIELTRVGATRLTLVGASVIRLVKVILCVSSRLREAYNPRRVWCE